MAKKVVRRVRIPGLDNLKQRIDAAIRWRAAETVAPVARRAQDLHDWVARVEGRAEWSENELRRIAPQIAAIEVRLAELDDALRTFLAQAPAVDPSGHALFEMITAEHQRIRARLSAVAFYEERLRRLEG